MIPDQSVRTLYTLAADERRRRALNRKDVSVRSVRMTPVAELGD